MVGGFLHVISDPIAEGQRLADVETGSFVLGGGVHYYSPGKIGSGRQMPGHTKVLL